MTNLSQSPDGKAITTKTMFSRETAVSTKIQADAAIIWSLLTNAADFARWNSTIISLDGNIEVGETLQLKSTLDESRTFKLKVKEMVPEQRLVWGDSQGSRVYALQQSGDGVVFSMTEKIGGLFFPLFARFIPPFDDSFEQFAADLKQEAEAIQNSKN
ncbi:SRPBCC domain-containing protein [Candidatus Leptofilum sp.]|uniref:SRPBCC domain-containing protein n=1 Tax=Candidatus Leptofilum sp. TaxID=3241576 RepID=UPI003B5CE75D